MKIDEHCALNQKEMEKCTEKKTGKVDRTNRIVSSHEI